MLKLLKLCLEETATWPARDKDLNPLELTLIMEPSVKVHGGLPPSAVVKVCPGVWVVSLVLSPLPPASFHDCN